ncbi:MAG: helix-turn-helix domain-containing protein [Conexivisphaera sp.]
MPAPARDGVLDLDGDLRRVAVFGSDGGPPFASEIPLRILGKLRLRPMYPRELARELGVGEQVVYYHVRRLEGMGLIRRLGSLRVRGASAHIYAASYDGYAQLFSAPPERQPRARPIPRKLLAFFDEFVRGGTLNASFVVGSPEPHGPFRAAARDGHYAVQLALALGALAAPPSAFAVKLDVDVRAERSYEDNLIVVGGPGTNLVASELNPHLPVRFMEDNYWRGLSDGEGRAFDQPTDAVIAKIPNPFSPGRFAVLVAGVRHVGTKSAVLALSTDHERVLGPYEGGAPFAVVVRGYDVDGDGKVDTVEPLRYYSGAAE